jgi:hypothetical protein
MEEKLNKIMERFENFNAYDQSLIKLAICEGIGIGLEEGKEILRKNGFNI